MDAEQYVKERLEGQIDWYDRKSQRNQKWFKFLRVTEIICAAVIPFIAGMFGDIIYGQISIGILGVIIAISAGLSSLNKHQEIWLTYRTTCETLIHEKFLFLTACKPYDCDCAFTTFVERIEGLISKENSQWSRNSRKKSDTKNGN